jgi:hypothetical protein
MEIETLSIYSRKTKRQHPIEEIIVACIHRVQTTWILTINLVPTTSVV